MIFERRLKMGRFWNSWTGNERNLGLKFKVEVDEDADSGDGVVLVVTVAKLIRMVYKWSVSECTLKACLCV